MQKGNFYSFSCTIEEKMAAMRTNITSSTDSLGQTVTNIKTFANGAKNDYNYGMGV